MKRLLLFVAVLLFATAAFAGTADRDMLILPDGTVYSVASEEAFSFRGEAASMLVFTAQSGEKTTRSVIPESVNTGSNSHPTLAYDPGTQRLFLIWLRMTDPRSSELMVAAYIDGEWRPAVSLDSKRAVRYNLSIGITRRVQQQQRDGSFAESAALVLHAAWYEQGSGTNGPRYAVMMLGGGGTVSAADIHDLTEFVEQDGSSGISTAEINGDSNRDFYRHVAVLAGPTPDAVDVVFADPRTSSFHRTTLRPIADVRIHIPVGVRGGGPKLGGPKKLDVAWSGRTSTIESTDGKTLIFCSTTEGRIDYVKYSDGKWSAAQQVTLSDKVTAESAMTALARMAAASQ